MTPAQVIWAGVLLDPIWTEDVMTNKLAVWIVVILILAAIVDYVLYGTEHFVFLGKQLYWFIWWIKFWR